MVSGWNFSLNLFTLKCERWPPKATLTCHGRDPVMFICSWHLFFSLLSCSSLALWWWGEWLLTSPLEEWQKGPSERRQTKKCQCVNLFRLEPSFFSLNCDLPSVYCNTGEISFSQYPIKVEIDFNCMYHWSAGKIGWQMRWKKNSQTDEGEEKSRIEV